MSNPDETKDDAQGGTTPLPVATAARRRLMAGALIFVIYALIIWKYMGAYAGGADPTGYLNSAKLLGRGTLCIPQPVLPGLDVKDFAPYTFVPHGMRPVGTHEMAALFPPGLSLAIFLTAKITGWNLAPHLVMLAACLLGVLGTAWLADAWGLPWKWTWFAALMLAVSPIYLVMSLHLMSDVPALTTATLAVVLAWKSRGRDSWAPAAGAMVAAAVLVRPNNILVMLPVAICLGCSWRRWLLLCAGGLPGAVFYCAFDHFAYGHALETGYSTYGKPSSLFDRAVIPATLLYYAKWLPVCITPLGMLALGLPWLVRAAPRSTVVLLVWIVGYFAFYVACVFTGMTWTNMRYIMPAFPACIVGTLLVAQSLFAKSRAGISGRFTKPVTAGMTLALVASLLAWDIAWSRKLGVTGSGRFMRNFYNASGWAAANLPANAVILCKETGGSLYYYDSFQLVCSDCLDHEQWAKIRNACAASHAPIYAAMIFPIDAQDTLTARLDGKWTLIKTVRDITFWRFDG